MSNSPLVSYTQISPNRGNTVNGKWKPDRTHKIDTITIHCVVGQLSVERLGEVFAPSSKQASANYGIGSDGRIGMYVEEKDRSWCSSNAANDNRAITIECASDTTDPYAINDKVYASLVKLCADICKRNGIKELKWKADKSLIGQVDKQNMTVHRWFAKKACPGDYIYNRLGKIANEVNELLNPTTNTPEEETMTLNDFKKLWNEMRAELKDNDAHTYSNEARKWALSNGLIEGVDDSNFNGAWMDYLTREQLVTVLYRFAQMISGTDTKK